jgi:Ca-activated chloride channel homolog
MACKQRMGPRDWKKPTRRILILISDGEDNASHITREAAVLEALKSGVVIFTINTSNSGTMRKRGEYAMEKLAKLTGGESFSDFNRKDAPKILASIQELIDGMYYLSYVPPDASKSSVHEVEIKRASKDKFELTYAGKYLWNP